VRDRSLEAIRLYRTAEDDENFRRDVNDAVDSFQNTVSYPSALTHNIN